MRILHATIIVHTKFFTIRLLRFDNEYSFPVPFNVTSRQFRYRNYLFRRIRCLIVPNPRFGGFCVVVRKTIYVQCRSLLLICPENRRVVERTMSELIKTETK